MKVMQYQSIRKHIGYTFRLHQFHDITELLIDPKIIQLASGYYFLKTIGNPRGHLYRGFIFLR